MASASQKFWKSLAEQFSPGISQGVAFMFSLGLLSSDGLTGAGISTSKIVLSHRGPLVHHQNMS